MPLPVWKEENRADLYRDSPPADGDSFFATVTGQKRQVGIPTVCLVFLLYTGVVFCAFKGNAISDFVCVDDIYSSFFGGDVLVCYDLQIFFPFRRGRDHVGPHGAPFWHSYGICLFLPKESG